MGFYLEVPENHGKVGQLNRLHDAELLLRGCPKDFSDVPSDKFLICVMDNGMFEAAGVAYSEREMREFANPDGRPKSWMLIDKDEAIKMNPSLGELSDARI